MIQIVGAGPGDPELITVKGMNALKEADIVIYAGSLVNPQLLAYCKKDCTVYDSAGMNLDEVIAVMKAEYAKGKKIVRLHTGDPSIYGAIREQMDLLSGLDIPFTVIPGVSSFCAAAAALKKEYVLPEVSQTVILTRMEGRTPVPEKEDIRNLAKINATMIIFLSVHLIEELVERLKAGYPADTPCAVVYKASWPEEKQVVGTLADIAEKVQEQGIGRTALITVGRFLGDEYALSKLYDKSFSHGYREAKD
ncbi:MAG TPA: precorrin-4 C(11)-methyltransferase [Clostridiales bacterium]|nr:precorrin-4 C(11)-methyltransferase [Clostridiales bacterium]